MRRLGGKEVADEIMADLKIREDALKDQGTELRLAILRGGQREDERA